MKNSRWRYIEDDGSSASLGLAADEYIARKLHLSPYSHIIRLYTYRGPSVIVGRNQDIESEVNLACCTKLGIDINRRPTGGGAIVMGEGQLGIAIAGPVNDQSPLLASKTVFGPFTRGIIVALGLMGIKSEFRQQNDIYVKGRKIAGLASCTFDEHPAGLYHASILADMDTDLMQRLLKKPGRKDGSIITVSSELDRYVSTNELREYVKRGFEKALNAELIPAPLNKEELAEIRKLEERKYKSRDWIYYGREYSTRDYHTQYAVPGTR